jgi:hypothetical protein
MHESRSHNKNPEPFIYVAQSDKADVFGNGNRTDSTTMTLIFIVHLQEQSSVQKFGIVRLQPATLLHISACL